MLQRSIRPVLTCLLCGSIPAASAPVVTAMTPAPGTSGGAPSFIQITCDQALDPASISLGTVALVRSGADGVFGNGNDVAVPLAVSLAAGNAIRITPTTALGSDTYRVSLLSSTIGQQAVSLSGSSHVSIPSSSALATGSQVTAEAWFYFVPGGDGNPRVISRGFGDLEISTYGTGSSRPFGIALNLSSGFVNVVTAGSILDANTWYHVALTYDGSHVTGYVNGAVVLQVAATGTIISSSTPLRFGLKGGNEALAGVVDEVSYWSVARTQAQILGDMDQSPIGSEAGLVGYWDLDETSGQVVFDASPNHLNGTLGADATVAGDDPARVSSPLSGIGVAAGGVLLDGEFGSTFPTGNGVAGGRFTASFAVNVSSGGGSGDGGGCGSGGGAGVGLLLSFLLFPITRFRR